MNLKEKFIELEKIPEAGHYFAMSQIGLFINFMESAIDELDDEEITTKFAELQDTIFSKREALANIECDRNKV